MMQIFKRKGSPEITKVVVVTPAIPETFDLIGLSAEQMAIIAILTGNCAGTAKGVQQLYDAAYTAIGVDNDDMPETEAIVQGNCLSLSTGVVADLLACRK